MRWTIQQLLANSANGIDIDRHVDVSELTDRDKELIAISNAHVTGHVEVENEHAHFLIAVRGTMTLPDSNTLAETEVPFDIKMEESFRLDGLEPRKTMKRCIRQRTGMWICFHTSKNIFCWPFPCE
ncbi:hypothetical protein HUG15_15005 [Salicibibacter cibarius]|uniref:Uncharacterized protein n=1 Tax=Salicibibacter cibarius TaxID=2743000 RepID=A0A7T7CC89_9BACI|nr:hypothetical protein [Salicibibacter cibarius]QQK76742.1 hypothetical protein HUG15_15005 [Salicibibacter cibarius]